MKYLNKHVEEMLEGKHINYRGKHYWANEYTMEVYAMSYDSYLNGNINGYKVADITGDHKIVKA